MSPESGDSLSGVQRALALAEKMALQGRLYDKLAEEAERRAEEATKEARLHRAAATQAREVEEGIRRELVPLLPGGPGRPPLEKTPLGFLQEIQRLRDEEGLGRPSIVKEMAEYGLTEWQVRKAMEDLAGDNPGSSEGDGGKVEPE